MAGRPRKSSTATATKVTEPTVEETIRKWFEENGGVAITQERLAGHYANGDWQAAQNIVAQLLQEKVIVARVVKGTPVYVRIPE